MQWGLPGVHLSATTGRCGNRSCHCHKPDDPSHGPYAKRLLQRKEKAERQIAGFRRYQKLSRDLVDTNERICRARPVEDTLRPPARASPRPHCYNAYSAAFSSSFAGRTPIPSASPSGHFLNATSDIDYTPLDAKDFKYQYYR